MKLSWPFAITVSSAFIAAAIVFNQPPAVEAQSIQTPRFMVATAQTDVAWRIDTESGDLWRCFANGRNTPRCQFIEN